MRERLEHRQRRRPRTPRRETARACCAGGAAPRPARRRPRSRARRPVVAPTRSRRRRGCGPRAWPRRARRRRARAGCRSRRGPAATPIETVRTPPIPRRMGQRRRLDGGAHALDGGQRVLGRRARQHDQQLLATEPVGHVPAAQAAANRRGDRAQRLVAGEVPELVVVDLEAVDVAQRERERVAARLVAAPRARAARRPARADCASRSAGRGGSPPCSCSLSRASSPRGRRGSPAPDRSRLSILRSRRSSSAPRTTSDAPQNRSPAYRMNATAFGRVLEARPQQRAEQHEEQSRRQDPAAQPRLVGLGARPRGDGRRALRRRRSPRSPSTQIGSSTLSPEM